MEVSKRPFKLEGVPRGAAKRQRGGRRDDAMYTVLFNGRAAARRLSIKAIDAAARRGTQRRRGRHSSSAGTKRSASPLMQ